MWPFDETIEALNGIYALLEGVVSDVLSGVYEALVGVVYLVLYPVISVIGIILNTLTVIYNEMVGLLNNLMAIGTTFIDLLDTVFVGVLPLTIVILLGALITIVVVLRVYSFVKDIEILGFKL